jgi:hypothetical protein
MNTTIATQRQVSYLKDLLLSRVVADAGFASRCRARLAAGTLDKQSASDAISYLLRQPKQPVVEAPVAFVPPAPEFDPQSLELGLYEIGDSIFKVKMNKAGTNKYAEILNFTVGQAERLTAAGTVIKAKYTYDAGAIFRIRPEHRITGDRAKALTVIFRSCIVCGARLKAAQSVERGIGPVCFSRI